jgi:hypothetical protein
MSYWPEAHMAREYRLGLPVPTGKELHDIMKDPKKLRAHEHQEHLLEMAERERLKAPKPVAMHTHAHVAPAKLSRDETVAATRRMPSGRSHEEIMEAIYSKAGGPKVMAAKVESRLKEAEEAHKAEYFAKKASEKAKREAKMAAARRR